MSPVLLLLAATGWATAALAALRLRAGAELVARAVHEVRGPLTAAWMAVHPLAARGDGAGRAAAAAVESHLRRASRALTDLDAARRGHTGEHRAESLAVPSLLADLAAAWRPVAAAAGRELVISAPSPPGARVVADPVRVAQAAGNLVANALEHGAGRVELRPRVAGGRLRLEVRDEGRGPDAMPARPRGARGRGLAIAADLAGDAGGRLTVDREDGEAAVVLELPLAHGEQR